MASHSPSSMTTSTPASAATVARPFWYFLVTPVSLYMVSLSVLIRRCSLNPGQCLGRAQPGGTPAAEAAGDEAAGDGQQHREEHRADRHRRAEVNCHAVRRVRGRPGEAAGTAGGTARGTAEAPAAESPRPARGGRAGRLAH